MVKPVMVALVVVAGLLGCSSGGDDGDAGGNARGRGSEPLDGDGRDAYVLAFGEAGRDPVSGEATGEAGCVAEAIVDVVGVARLREVVTPREIAAAANGTGASLASLGVDVDADQADAIYEGVQGCGDPAQLLLDAIPGARLAGPVAECFKGHLDEELVHEVLVTRLVEGDEALADDPDIANQLTAVGRTCSAGTAT